jgi:hypothetical protein
MRIVWVWTLLALGAAGAARAADLTPAETRWLQAAWPVVAFAREARLPLDIVVQPQAAPGVPPLALAFVGQRCKLVLSMRGNDGVQATEARIEPELFNATLELMAAHELGHCRRYVDGTWQGLPAGFVAQVPEAVPDSSRAAWLRQQALRREEGYADLVGLAWVQQRHPQQYARLHAWLLAERSTADVAGTDHDTRAWARLAAPGTRFGGDSIFTAAQPLWQTGLAAGD